MKLIDAINQLQTLFGSAGLGPLNFKFPSPYNWHLLKSRPTSLGSNKNLPGETHFEVDIKAIEDKVINR